MNKYLPTAYQVWGKVLFSQACVNHCVHSGGGGLSTGVICLEGNVCSGGVVCPGGVCAQGGGVSSGVSHFSQRGWVSPIFQKMGDPPIREYGQCAVGTYPTGMHPCLF